MQFLRSSLAVAMCFAASLSWAAGYPERPVKVVLTAPPGPLDTFARAVLEKVSVKLKQPFVIENRPGAAGNLAADVVARSAPDGYTLLFALDTTFTVNPSLYRKLSFDPVKDFVAISLPVIYGQALTVNPGVGVSTVAEFVEKAKKQPMTYASGGNGSPSHLSMTSFLAAAGIQMTHVPYKGAAVSLVDVMAGQVDSIFAVESAVLAHSKAGKLKVLATSDNVRSQTQPDLPTIAESGYPSYRAVFGYVLMAPSRTPAAVIDLLAREVDAAMKTPEIRELNRSSGYSPTNLARKDVAGWIRQSRARWGEVISKAGISVD